MSNEILFKVILAIIPILGAIITGYLVPLLKNKLGTERLNLYLTWAKQAVQCAEMVLNDGNEKKAFCVMFLNNLINGKETILTIDQIDVIIESAVQELKLAEKEVAK